MIGKQVLLVDDEPLIRALLCAVLQADGFRVVEAGTGDQAVLLLGGQARFVAVVTDLQMPGKLDGIGVADHAALHAPGMPVVLMTGRPDAMERHLRDDESFLRKPFGPCQLSELLARVLEHG